MKYSIHFGLEKAGLPLVLTTDNPNNLCLLIDIGSTNDVIFDFVYNHFKNYFAYTTDSQNIIGIDGSLESSFIVNADLQFDDLRYKAPFVVLRRVQEETGIQILGILGIPFLIDNKWILDFSNLKIKSA